MIIILRGLPGSGKSTYARNLKDFITFSADAHHIVDGVYRFNPAMAGEAHRQCFLAYLLAIQHQQRCEDLCVDNTNTTLHEMAPYVAVANAYQRDYKILWLHCDLQTSLDNNSHSVPHSTIVAMHRNLLTEMVPPYWNQEILLQFRR